MQASTVPSYSFDNDDPEASDRHRYLSAILDEATFARLGSLGDLTGRRCLEVGAGGGSVAAWLARRAGPGGRVVATDLNPRHMTPHEGYTVLRHNLVTDPVPAGPWDVIHSRLVLMHIPQRREILHRLAAELAPGGALVIEDWFTATGSLVLAAPDPETEALVNAYQEMLIGRILPANGTDPSWAGQVHAAMLAEGLVDVDTRIEARSWPGGTPGALLIAANIGQLRDQFLAAGFPAAGLDRLGELAADPRLVLRSNYTYATIGRRPAGDAR